MKKSRLFASMLLVLGLLAVSSTVVFAAGGGFDEFGYNYQANIFVGAADGVDRVLDHAVWGDPTYANDLLVMKWNEQWDICNANGNIDPEYCAGAWENNEWNGMVPGGSGEIWHYKIVWVGPCGADYTPLANGGYCLWGQYEVIMDQGIDPGTGIGHIWLTHANPTGYGSY